MKLLGKRLAIALSFVLAFSGIAWAIPQKTLVTEAAKKEYYIELDEPFTYADEEIIGVELGDNDIDIAFLTTFSDEDYKVYQPGEGDVTYTSSNESAVTVSKDGIASFVGKGAAVVTIKWNRVTAEINFNVLDKGTFSKEKEKCAKQDSLAKDVLLKYSNVEKITNDTVVEFAGQYKELHSYVDEYDDCFSGYKYNYGDDDDEVGYYDENDEWVELPRSEDYYSIGIISIDILNACILMNDLGNDILNDSPISTASATCVKPTSVKGKKKTITMTISRELTDYDMVAIQYDVDLPAKTYTSSVYIKNGKKFINGTATFTNGSNIVTITTKKALKKGKTYEVCDDTSKRVYSKDWLHRGKCKFKVK